MATKYFSLALNNLRHRGIRSWLTILGIFLGIAAVVSLISLGNGLETAIMSQFGTLDVDKLVIENSGTGFGPPGSTAIKKLSGKDIDLIESINGVEFTISRLIRIVKVEYNKASVFRYITNLPEDKDKMGRVISSLNINIAQGKMIGLSDKGRIVIGNDIANTNAFGKEIRVGTKLELQGKSFEVLGILEKSSSFQTNQVIFTLESDLIDILDIPKGESDLIVAQISENNNMEDVAENIRRRLRRDRRQKEGEEDFSVRVPSQSLEVVNTILSIINLIISGIAAISLLVGGIGIANTMYTSVLERTREIGVMKSIGAQNKDILFIFIIESALLGLVGGIVGAISGLSLAFLVSIIAEKAIGQNILAVSISYPLLVASVLFSLTIGLVSGILPAIQASKLNPVEALRK